MTVTVGILYPSYEDEKTEDNESGYSVEDPIIVIPGLLGKIIAPDKKEWLYCWLNKGTVFFLRGKAGLSYFGKGGAMFDRYFFEEHFSISNDETQWTPEERFLVELALT